MRRLGIAMGSTCRIVAIGCLALLCGSLLPTAVMAQGGRDDLDENGHAPLTELKVALPCVYWNSKANGPLIAIDPETVKWTDPAEFYKLNPERRLDPEADKPIDPVVLNRLYPPKSGYGLSADVVARHFGHKLLRLPTMTIVIPPTMVVLNSDLKLANPSHGGEVEDRLRRLGATLTSAQWETLGSPAGLGRDDLSKEQQPLFDDILPYRPAIKHDKVVVEEGRADVAVDSSEDPQLLTDTQRQGIHLHLTRRAIFSLVDTKGQEVQENPFHREAADSTQLSLLSGHPIPAETYTAFGQAVRMAVQNHLKPGDLDLKQPLLHDTWVPLAGTKTVGDMLRVVRAKTGLEIYADARLASLKLYLSVANRPVHAADLLEALCWALTSTYRKIGPGADAKDFAYVLTYDRVGMPVLRAPIAEWKARGQTLHEAADRKTEEAIEKAKPAKYISYAADDLMKLSPESIAALHEEVLKMQRSGQYTSDITVPVSTLTTTQRQQLTSGLVSLDKSRSEDPNQTPINHDRVRVRDSYNLSLVIPGVGEVDDTFLYGMQRGSLGEDADVEPVVPDTAIPTAADKQRLSAEIAEMKRGPIHNANIILCFAPKTPEDAEAIFAAANRSGFRELWLPTPDSDAARKRLADYVAIGKKHGVAIGAQVSVISAPSDGKPLAPAAEDRNVFGEVGNEWAVHRKAILDAAADARDPEDFPYQPPVLSKGDMYAPDSHAARVQIEEQLRKVASVAGLGGIVLCNPAGPGHNWTAPRYYGNTRTGEEFGYTIANRLGFLRQHGYDPVDLETDRNDLNLVNVHGETSLPRFDVKGDGIGDGDFSFDDEDAMTGVQNAWKAFRAASESELLIALRTDLHTAHPGLPVYLSACDDNGEEATDYQCWNFPASIPFAAPTPNAGGQAKPLVSSAAPSGETVTRVVCKAKDLEYSLGYARMTQESLGDHPSLTQTDLVSYNVRQALQQAQRASPTQAPVRVLLDLTQMNLDQALLILKEAFRPVTP